MKFHQIRHATVIITFAGKRILVDPWFEPKDSLDPLAFVPGPPKRFPFVEMPIPPQEVVKNIDAVILTHLHLDHFSEYSAGFIDKSLPLFAQDEDDKMTLENMGFKDVTIMSENGTDYGDLKIFKTDCDHGSAEFYKVAGMRREASGFVLQSPKEAKKIYIIGDSLYVDCVKEAIRKHKPEVVVGNSCAAETPFGRILMTREDIKPLHEEFPFATYVASHLDVVPHATQGRKETNEYVKENHFENFVHVPLDGEEISF